MAFATTLGRSLCVPYNGDLELVRRLVASYGPTIHELYGTDDRFRSGRNVSQYPPAPIEDVLSAILPHGIGFNYLLNSVVLDDYLTRLPELRRHLTSLRRAGVCTLTVSSPYFVELAKDLGFEVSSSLMQHVRSETAASYLAQIGYQRIMLDEDELRNIPLVRRLVAATELPVEIIVNNCCLKECPFRNTHYNAEGISRPDFDSTLRTHLSDYCRQCKRFWYYDPAHFLRASWIRPEELPRYRAVGVRYFKLTGRTVPSSAIEDMVRIYSSCVWEGSVFAYLKPFATPDDLFGLENVDNDSLDRFFDFFFKHGCDGACDSCEHCATWARKLVRVPGHWRGEPLTRGAAELASTCSSDEGASS